MSQTVKNTEIVRKFVEKAFNEGNMGVADECLAEDFVRHDPDMGDVRGREEYKEFIQMNRTAFPDYHETIDDIITQGDTVMYRWTLRGTQEGEFMGVDPTGNEIEVTGMIDMHLEDGRITELWGNFDALGLLKQLDAVPE